jgi:penicillin amidase
LALIVVANIAVGYFWVQAGLPRLSGQLAAAGLAAPVEIVRDAHGVPHIYARSEPDAYFALGYVHAQDRLWQMEVNRRLGAGRLAEMFGKQAAHFDGFMRMLGLYRHAEATVANLDSQTQAVLAAYAAGVNAFLDRKRDGPMPTILRLPPEFLIFRHAPEPWRPADSILWAKVMAWDLGGNIRSELMRALSSRHLTPERVAEFLPPYPGDDSIPLPDLSVLYAELPFQTLLAGAPLPTPGAGSNNWVVAGSRSVTGKPLLANDPHLRLASPSVWYLAHLEAPGLNAIGATLPGVPAVVLGRNDRIAWGMTNTGPDVQDLYVERVDPEDPDNYLTPDGPRPFERRDELIRIRGADDILTEVRTTRHGPVMSDFSFRGSRFLEERFDLEKYVLAFAWTAMTDDDLTVQAALKAARAPNWEAFVSALRDYHVPQQSIVYADVDGNIGMYAPARVPVRKPANDIRGLMPAPGWKAAYDWDGFIPFEELPHSFNPASGRIHTANHKIVPAGYPHHITSEWQAPYRARRIDALLSARARHSVESFAALQADVHSLMAADFLPLMLAPEPSSEAAAAARELLADWDGTMDRDRAEPLIFAAWYRELTRLVYADELAPMFQETWALRPVFLRNVLSHQHHWCDDVATEAKEGCDERVSQALVAALERLEAEYGDDMSTWRWGEAHFALSDHRPLNTVPLLNRFFDIRLPTGGDSFTVNAARHDIANGGAPFVEHHGPGLRAIYDLADLDRSLFIHSTGQSGNAFSANYRDFAERWRDVDYIPMSTERAAIAAGALGTLTLVPAAGEPQE